MDISSMLLADSFRFFVVLAFIAVVLLVEGLYSYWSANKSPEAKKIEERLRALAAGAVDSAEASILKQRLLSDVPAVQRLLMRVPRMGQLDRLIEQSGLRVTAARLVFYTVMAGLAAWGAATAANLPGLPALALIAAGTAMPLSYVRRCRAQRVRKLERQLPDALDLIGRALRAGHAFASGMQMAGEEMSEPIATEFRITHEEVNFGVSLPQALQNMAARVPSTDLRYFVVAVLIQRESGGNLTEVLGNLSTLIRERFKLLEKVRVLASEGKLSAWILGVLPFALAAVINVINPGFLRVLWEDALGLKMINAGLMMMLTGIVWMRQIIRIHV